MYILNYLKDSSRLEAKNCMYRILMAGKYHNVGYLKYWLWGPFHNAYHARPFNSRLRVNIMSGFYSVITGSFSYFYYFGTIIYKYDMILIYK